MGERGICPACSRSFKLTRTGLVARHQTRGSALFCPGSGQRPLPHGRQRCTSLNPQCWSKALGYSRCDCPGDDGPLGEQLPRPTVLVMNGGETGSDEADPELLQASYYMRLLGLSFEATVDALNNRAGQCPAPTPEAPCRRS